MRVTLRKCEGRSFTVVLPTRMIFSPTMMRLGMYIGRKYTSKMPNISNCDLRALCGTVKQIKRRYGCYELVTVESGQGDLVKITL